MSVDAQHFGCGVFHSIQTLKIFYMRKFIFFAELCIRLLFFPSQHTRCPTGHVNVGTNCFTVVCPWLSVRIQHIPVAPSVAVIIERHRF